MQMLDEALGNILDEIVKNPEKIKRQGNTTQPTISAPSWIPEPEEVCPICGGSGWMPKIDRHGCEVYVECSCGIRKKSILDEKLRFAAIPDAFRDMRLYQFDLNIYREGRSRKLISVAYDCIRCWLDDFPAMQKARMGLYIFSGTKGSGKTRIAASIANELIHVHGISVKFSTSTQIINEIKKTWDRSSDMTESRLLDDLAGAEVLLIDDFGTEKLGTEKHGKAWLDDRFYQVINERYQNKKVTIFTSNYSLDELPYDERLTSRIRETAYQIPFPEESVRNYLAEKNMEDLMIKVSEFREREAKQMSMEDMLGNIE